MDVINCQFVLEQTKPVNSQKKPQPLLSSQFSSVLSAIAKNLVWNFIHEMQRSNLMFQRNGPMYHEVVWNLGWCSQVSPDFSDGPQTEHKHAEHY